MKSIGYVFAGVLGTLCVLSPLSMAGGFGVGSGGLQGGSSGGVPTITTSGTTTTFSGPIVINRDISDPTGAAGYITTTGGIQLSTNKAIYLNGATQTAYLFFDGNRIFAIGPTGGLTAEGDTTSPARAAFAVTPQNAEPTGANAVGDMYVTAAGVLRICTVAGTPGTWVNVGSQ